MSLYYVLANTVVNGEIVIQGKSVTYSASASAFDSANTSFKDAEKVATINSNAAAIMSVRKIIDNILVQYAYVLSDLTITSMISNGLKTEVQPIIPIALALIASTVDGINFILNKNVTIQPDEMVIVASGESLYIPAEFRLSGTGIFKIGTGPSQPPTASQGSSFIEAPDGMPITNQIIVEVGADITINGPAYGTPGVAITNDALFSNSGFVTIVNASFINSATGSWFNSSTGSAIIKPPSA